MAIDYFEIFKNTMKDVDRERLLEMLYTCFEMQRKIQNYKIEELKEDEQGCETEEPKEESKEIKKITLVFENCETCELDTSMFDRLAIYGITETIKAFLPYKSTHKYYSCDDLILGINEKGLKQNTDCYGNDYQPLEDRLKTCKDITAVDITYEDNTKQVIYVLWNDENDYENKYQTIHQWSNDYITVRIGKEDV